MQRFQQGGHAVQQHDRAHVLVVDDNEDIREMLCFQIELDGHQVVRAEHGRRALELMRARPFDLVLLDIMMPYMNGYELLEHLKADATLRHIPVIVISAFDDLNSIVRCINLGAEDYLFKPFNTVLLKARVDSCLEKKRLRDQEQAYLKQLEAEQEKSEQLLLNLLPEPVAQRLKQGDRVIADSFADVTVLFADIINFTQLSSHLSPEELVDLLNRVFSQFDRLTEKHGLEKIKTIGDAYMVVGGLPRPRQDHVQAVAAIALDMLETIEQLNAQNGHRLEIRIGINSGPVIAGVIGQKKFSYDLWGDTVNIASRMESQGLAGRIQVTLAVYDRLQDKYLFQERGAVQIKGKGTMTTYLLTGRKPHPSMDVPIQPHLAEPAMAAWG
jgi:adenylate cyclase